MAIENSDQLHVGFVLKLPDDFMIHHDNSIPTGIDYLGKHRAYFLREKRSSTSLGSRMKKIELQQHVI
jgi:hypothetical protein